MPVPQPKRKANQYAPTEGQHRVSPDGSMMRIGGATFRRTMLPSVAKPSREQMELESTLENLDKLDVKEAE